MSDITKPLDKLLFDVQLLRIRASASKSVYEILGGIKQKKLAELRKADFEYAARNLRELLSYVDQQIKNMEDEL